MILKGYFMKNFFIFCFVITVAWLCGCNNTAVHNDAELFEGTNNNLKRFAGVMPPEVKTIACIAPASYPGTKFHRMGVELLRQAGYNVKVMPHTFVRQKTVPQAPLKDRLADFYAAWNDPEVDMIFCVRGGKGCEELLDNIDWSKLKKRPELYFQGYSDATLINCALTAKKNGHPIAGPMAGSMVSLPDDAIEVMRDINHGRSPRPVKLQTLAAGDCQGLPLAGLLQRFSIVADKDYCPDTKGRIIFIEAVNIDAGTIKKDLNKLLDRKFFAGASGIVFCHFARCKNSEQIDSILKEFALKVKIPVFSGFPFGHKPQNYSIDLTRPVIIRNGILTFPQIEKANNRRDIL